MLDTIRINISLWFKWQVKMISVTESFFFHVDIIVGVRNVVHFEGHFREAAWPILLVGQLFGVMPLLGIKSRSISHLRLKWKSVQTFYSLLILAILVVYSLYLAWKTFSTVIEFSSIGSYEISSFAE